MLCYAVVLVYDIKERKEGRNRKGWMNGMGGRPREAKNR